MNLLIKTSLLSWYLQCFRGSQTVIYAYEFMYSVQIIDLVIDGNIFSGARGGGLVHTNNLIAKYAICNYWVLTFYKLISDAMWWWPWYDQDADLYAMVIWVSQFAIKHLGCLILSVTLHEKLMILFHFSVEWLALLPIWDLKWDYVVCRMASWCRKCIFLKPKLEKLAVDYYPRWDSILFLDYHHAQLE